MLNVTLLKLCAVIINVKSTEQSHGKEPSPADLLHISFVTVVVTNR
jgi:hypothetical protein